MIVELCKNINIKTTLSGLDIHGGKGFLKISIHIALESFLTVNGQLIDVVLRNNIYSDKMSLRNIEQVP